VSNRFSELTVGFLLDDQNWTSCGTRRDEQIDVMSAIRLTGCHGPGHGVIIIQELENMG